MAELLKNVDNCSITWRGILVVEVEEGSVAVIGEAVPGADNVLFGGATTGCRS